MHLSTIRAQWGLHTTYGVPTSYRWEALVARDPSAGCARDNASAAESDFVALKDGSEQLGPSRTPMPTRRSWFVDVEACALRLQIDATNGGPPVVRELEAIEGARDVLRAARAEDDGSLAGFGPERAIDGAYAGRWAGEPGKGKWHLTLTLPQIETIDRVSLVLGLDGTTVPRTDGRSGRSYAMANGPRAYVLEASDDGRTFVPLATQPTRVDGTAIPVRRRLVTLDRPTRVKVLRLSIDGATNALGVQDANAFPVVREIGAYRESDHHRVLSSPWVLSVNANPSALMHEAKGHELFNDVWFSTFLQRRFSWFVPAMVRDDRYVRLFRKGEGAGLLDVPPGDDAGEALELVEGDDPTFDPAFLAAMSPKPIVVFSGANDWEFQRGKADAPDAKKHWRWNPMRDARDGGMGQIAAAVQSRVAPFLGFCGGAQLLALLESHHGKDDGHEIDQVLRRTNGRRIRGIAPASARARSWPGDSGPREEIVFDPDDPLFGDLSGPKHRRTTHELPESHVDVIRPDAFLADGPLSKLDLVATSLFCGSDVISLSPRDPTLPDPDGPGRCATVVETFRSRSGPYPVIGAQFHAEQYDFPVADRADPWESTADGRLFIGAVYEMVVDAYLQTGG
jgi:hypothetical protein